VSPDDFPKLFTRFWRSADRRDLGAGLGLSICLIRYQPKVSPL
jgi:signal transduction histidine kinase